jgi:hypothetical protein
MKNWSKLEGAWRTNSGVVCNGHLDFARARRCQATRLGLDFGLARNNEKRSILLDFL